MNYSTDYLYQQALQWINNMLLCDEIRLKDVPFEIRTSKSSIYSSALRISQKISLKRFIGDLQILCDDIYRTKDEKRKHSLLGCLETYLFLSERIGEKEFEDFKKDINEDILLQLQGNNESVQKNIKDELRKSNIKQ